MSSATGRPDVSPPLVIPYSNTAVTEELNGGQPMARHALVLGMLIGLGAFGIDAYLPAFPAIAKSLGVDEGKVQYSLVSYFVSLAFGQLIYGPISDRFGRRPPLIVGFALFIAASIGAAMATSIEMLVAMRFVQGLGACAGMVVSRAVVRDLRSGEEAARLFALMLLVLGVSPILAPIVGERLVAHFPWQSVFWFLAALGATCLVLIVLFLEETNPPARRSGGLGAAFASYGKLARDLPFVGTVLVGGGSQAAVFAYIAGTPFVYLTLHHLPGWAYSVLFAVNAVALIGFAQFNVPLLRRFGMERVLRGGTLVQTAAAVALLAAALGHFDGVAVIAVALFFVVGCQGAIGPTSSVAALEPHAANAGAASAMMGALQFGAGAVSSGLVSAFFDGTSVPMAAVIAGCAGTALLLVFLGSSSRAAAAAPDSTPAAADPCTACAGRPD